MGESTAANTVLPRGLASVDEWEQQLDRSIASCAKIDWRKLNPKLAARLLRALSLEVDASCEVPSVRQRMETLRHVVHAKIDRWAAAFALEVPSPVEKEP